MKLQQVPLGYTVLTSEQVQGKLVVVEGHESCWRPEYAGKKVAVLAQNGNFSRVPYDTQHITAVKIGENFIPLSD